MIPEFEISNRLGRIFIVHGKFAWLQSFMFRETSDIYGAMLTVLNLMPPLAGTT